MYRQTGAVVIAARSEKVNGHNSEALTLRIEHAQGAIELRFGSVDFEDVE
ncbi:hypothetical protein GCM10027169_27490 [Gordonia jinhuaensis]|uniref:Uncharacterized protein n=1 Tax=Gordonia jinhuaensis TaxID=1517702 RepID=A0A916TAA2_9ACTN|nr:hypothetical protein GCM10011489_26640 [Gordonia jinhuaensis]